MNPLIAADANAHGRIFSTEIKGLDQHPSKDNADCADSFYLLPKKNICWLVVLTI